MTSRSSVYVVVEEIELWPPSPSIGVIRACGRGGLGRVMEVMLTASMLTVLRLNSLSVGLKQRTVAAGLHACMCERSGD